MKKTYILIIAILCGILQTACTSEDFSAQDGQGKFALSILTADVETEDMPVGRSTTTFNVQDFKVSLTDNQGIALITDKTYSELSDGDRTLPSGTGYQISVESCDAEEALTVNDGWGQARFVGNATFDIVSDETTPVAVECIMENAGLMVLFDETFTTKFPTYAATTQDARTLVFKSSNVGSVGYYALESATDVVSLRLTGSAGGWSDRIDKTQNVAITKGKITRLTVNYDENSGDIDIEFGTDTDMDESSDDVTIK